MEYALHEGTNISVVLGSTVILYLLFTLCVTPTCFGLLDYLHFFVMNCYRPHALSKLADDLFVAVFVY
jgi:hypothetical protein